MLILFDQGTPRPIQAFLQGHTVKTVAQHGWAELSNGELLRVAEDSGFEVLLTTDKNLVYQQNLKGRRLAILVLGSTRWPVLRKHIGLIVAAVNAATPGTYAEIKIPAA